MDGNGRWAQIQGKSRQVGHKKGAKNVRFITDWCAKNHIAYLTLYAFSTENWNRPKKEVDFLMKLLERYLQEETQTYHQNKIRFRAIGDIDFFYQPLKSLIYNLESQTATYTNLTQTLALNYGSRNEIARACIKALAESNVCNKNIAQESNNKSKKRFLDSSLPFANSTQINGDYAIHTINPKEMESLIHQHLDTTDMPDVDLLIRTGGEQRLSNFLLWQASYAELAFTKTLWPDFGSDELKGIIQDFYLRQRRFGGLQT